MFIVVTFFLTSLYHGTQAISLYRRDVSPICPLKRSLFTIIWDCWSTIFICAWVSVHPNIPPATEWGRKALGRRAKLMFWAVVAPEVVLAWAVRQWFAAGEIAEIYNKNKNIPPLARGFWASLWLVIKCWIIGRKVETNEAWTRIHGHFLCMGGFVVGNDEEAGNDGATTLFAKNEVISFESFKRLIEEDNFEVSITEQEIEDKSKSDSLSKFIAILQTSKFIVQCIVRWRQKLALTELELITLALASLNAITYTFWWAKPYDVKVPVPVKVERTRSNRRPQDMAVSPAPATVNRSEHPSISMFPFTATQFRSYNTEFFKGLLLEIIDILQSPWKDHSFWTLVFRWFFMLPICLTFVGFFPIYFVIVYIFASLNDIVDTFDVPPGATHVPTFYAPRTRKEDVFRFVIFAIFGVVFGGLHCIGWRFAYPTPIEQTVWRAASVAITVIPFVSMLIMLISLMASTRIPEDKSIEKIVTVVTGAAITFSTLQLFLYVLARLVLLGQAAASLRAPRPSALQDINWLKFFPHVASSDNP